MNRNQQQIDRIINNLTQKINSENAGSAPTENEVNNLLKGLNDDQVSKVKSILKDPEATKKILETPQAQALMKKLGDKNK